jgi:hypothetical protein
MVARLRRNTQFLIVGYVVALEDDGPECVPSGFQRYNGVVPLVLYRIDADTHHDIINPKGKRVKVRARTWEVSQSGSFWVQVASAKV